MEGKRRYRCPCSGTISSIPWHPSSPPSAPLFFSAQVPPPSPPFHSPAPVPWRGEDGTDAMKGRRQYRCYEGEETVTKQKSEKKGRRMDRGTMLEREGEKTGPERGVKDGARKEKRRGRAAREGRRGDRSRDGGVGGGVMASVPSSPLHSTGAGEWKGGEGGGTCREREGGGGGRRWYWCYEGEETVTKQKSEKNGRRMDRGTMLEREGEKTGLEGGVKDGAR